MLATKHGISPWHGDFFSRNMGTWISRWDFLWISHVSEQKHLGICRTIIFEHVIVDVKFNWLSPVHVFKHMICKSGVQQRVEFGDKQSLQLLQHQTKLDVLSFGIAIFHFPTKELITRDRIWQKVIPRFSYYICNTSPCTVQVPWFRQIVYGIKMGFLIVGKWTPMKGSKSKPSTQILEHQPCSLTMVTYPLVI